MKLLTAPIILLSVFAVCCSLRGSGAVTTERSGSTIADCSSSTDGLKRIDINSANAEELKSLTGIGEVLAGRIVEYRGRHGRFRKAADIIVVEGMSEKKYRKIERAICAGN